MTTPIPPPPDPPNRGLRGRSRNFYIPNYKLVSSTRSRRFVDQNVTQRSGSCSSLFLAYVRSLEVLKVAESHSLYGSSVQGRSALYRNIKFSLKRYPGEFRCVISPYWCQHDQLMGYVLYRTQHPAILFVVDRLVVHAMNIK